jgi:hypothetical protein
LPRLLLRRPVVHQRVLLKQAAEDPDAQYLGALGRAYEGSLGKGDTKYIELARVAYESASKLDPKLFNAQLGQGKMLNERRDWESALTPLLAAKDLVPTHSDMMYNTGLAYRGLRFQSEKHRKAAAEWLEAAFNKGKPPLDLVRRAEAASMLGQLYKDINNPGKTVTRLGEEIEKTLGTTPTWLVDTYFQLGDHNPRAASACCSPSPSALRSSSPRCSRRWRLPGKRVAHRSRARANDAPAAIVFAPPSRGDPAIELFLLARIAPRLSL